MPTPLQPETMATHPTYDSFTSTISRQTGLHQSTHDRYRYCAGPTGELASSCGAATSALATFVAWTVRRSAPAASTRPKIIGGVRLARATTHVTTTSDPRFVSRLGSRIPSRAMPPAGSSYIFSSARLHACRLRLGCGFCRALPESDESGSPLPKRKTHPSSIPTMGPKPMRRVHEFHESATVPQRRARKARSKAACKDAVRRDQGWTPLLNTRYLVSLKQSDNGCSL